MATTLHHPWPEFLRALFKDHAESPKARAVTKNGSDAAFNSRCELVATALSQGVPLQEVEDYLDWLDESPPS